MNARDVIAGVILTIYNHNGKADAASTAGEIMREADRAGLAIYDTRTHAAVPREVTVSVFCALDRHAESRHPQRLWQPAWDAVLAAAEAEAKETE